MSYVWFHASRIVSSPVSVLDSRARPVFPVREQPFSMRHSREIDTEREKMDRKVRVACHTAVSGQSGTPLHCEKPALTCIVDEHV